MSEAQSSSKPEELRLAVAMRGGVSLAAWMGGVCCEIARLRRAASLPHAEDKDVYRKLLCICGYKHVTVDVLLMTVGSAVAALLAAGLVQLPWLTEHIRSCRMLLLLYAPLWVQSYLPTQHYLDPPNSAAVSGGGRQSLSDM